MEESLQDEHLPVSLQERLLAQERALTRISQLIKSLLDLSHLELSESLSKETFALNELICSVAEEFQGLMQDQKLLFVSRFDSETYIHADREMIRRMLINLLDNAIRYNQANGEIRCQAKTDQGQVVLLFANTGPGIPPTDRERVFDQFYRCEKSRSTAHGGSGLGLAIVKRIVELHDGDIAVADEPPSWTVFTVRIPSGLSA